MHDGFLGLTPWKDFLPGADVSSPDTTLMTAANLGLR